MLKPWFLAAAIFLSAVSADAKHFSHPKIEQDIQLLSDGSAVVQEIRTFEFSGQFGRAYVDRLPKGQYGQYKITYDGVWDADSGDELEWAQSTVEGYTRVTWRYSAADETKRFRLRYRIDWAVQKYRDAAQFYWKCIEDDHAAIDSVILTITLPEKPPTLFAAFVHTRAGRGDRQFSTDSSSVVLRMGYVPTSSFLEARVLTDTEVFPDAAVLIGEDRASLLEAERRILEPTLMEWAARYVTQLLMFGYFFMIGLFALVLYLLYGREPKIEEGRYLREPPSDIPPCMVPAIMTQEEIDPKSVIDGFAAALLECTRQGYLTMSESEDADRATVFTLTAAGKSLLDGQPVILKSYDRTISSFETQVLKTLFRDFATRETLSESSLKIWAQQQTGTGTEIQSFATSWGTTMRAWFETERFELDNEESGDMARSVGAGSFIVGVATFMLLFLTGEMTFITMLMPVSIVVVGFLLGPILRKRTLQGAREVHRWEAFRNFLTDFSSLDRASEKMLPMWDRFLVYATALGVASEFSKQLKLAAQQHPELVMANSGSYFGGVDSSPLRMGSLTDFHVSDIVHSLTTSLRDSAAEYNSMLNDFPGAGSSSSDWDFGSSGGGGGFGGGFSGGGGGGGGGGRSGAS